MAPRVEDGAEHWLRRGVVLVELRAAAELAHGGPVLHRKVLRIGGVDKQAPRRRHVGVHAALHAVAPVGARDDVFRDVRYTGLAEVLADDEFVVHGVLVDALGRESGAPDGSLSSY